MKKKSRKKLRILLTVLFIAICVSAIFLVLFTIDEGDESLGDLRTVPHSIDLDKIIDGGPPKDGIPSIDDPSFIKMAEADPVINDDDQVLVVQTFQETKLFPLKILVWHQIVNDATSQTPQLVTYDPFTNNASVYKSVYNRNQKLKFGVSGKLYESNMLMYDRDTNSLWKQSNGEGVVGEMTGALLPKVNSYFVPWKYAKKKFPKALVLSRETGTERDYDNSPYEVYLNSDNVYFDISTKDSRLEPKEMVYGIYVNEIAKAYPEQILYGKWIISDSVDKMPIVVLKNPQTGAVKAFKGIVYGWPVKFELTEDGIIDDRYKSKWDFDGECIEGKVRGWKLVEIPVTASYWFAWYVFNQNTELYLANDLPKEE